MLRHIFNLTRLPNLLIVGLTQFLLQYLVILPAYHSAGIKPDLDLIHFTLLVFCTILIALGGYLINDIFDVEIDKVNKPQRMVIGKVISEAAGWKLYYFTMGLGLIIAIYLGFHIGNPELISLYPAAVFALYFYSRNLKTQVLTGNLIVAVFCAFVAGIVWFAERNSFVNLFNEDHSLATSTATLLFAYMAFAFLSTMIRELIKDMEDAEGDKQQGCRTLPIVYGNKIAKSLTVIIGSILLMALLWWSSLVYNQKNWIALMYLCVGIVGPLIFIMARLRNAKSQHAFHQLSNWSKYLMLSGIIYLFFN